ncbi:MAG: hypothetical protein AB1446_12385 [Bacillota bacterium]
MSLTQEMKQYLKSLGADLVGVAPVERFEGAPRRPEEILPGARSVVVIGLRIPLASVDAWKKLMKSYQVYGHGWLNFHLSFMEYHLAQFLEDRGYHALPLSSLDPYYDMKTFMTEGLSNRHAAVAAGLGEFGWNNLFLSPRFGPRVRLTTTITSAPLEADPMYSGPPLCLKQRCLKCVEECPMQVFDRQDGIQVTIAGRAFEMSRLDGERKYLCRWCEHGLTRRGGALTEIPIPEEKTPEAYLDAWDKRDRYQKRRQGMFGGIYFCGRCVHVCPVGRGHQAQVGCQ